MYAYIAAIIIVSLSAYACYALINQTIEKRQIHKHRVIMMLKTKYRNLQHMTNGFPKFFLTNDLAKYLYAALIDTGTRLSTIEPNNQRYSLEIDLYTGLHNEISTANAAQKVRVDSPHQMKEVHKHLQELQGYMLKQAELNLINKKLHSAYQEQIKHLDLQLSVDTYRFHADAAQQTGKLRLAIHYLTLAKKLLFPERASPAHKAQILAIESLIAQLETRALTEDNAAEEQNTAHPGEHGDAQSSSPKKEKETESWKKKQVYD
jgi:hypothetical protein